MTKYKPSFGKLPAETARQRIPRGAEGSGTVVSVAGCGSDFFHQKWYQKPIFSVVPALAYHFVNGVVIHTPTYKGVIESSERITNSRNSRNF